MHLVVGHWHLHSQWRLSLQISLFDKKFHILLWFCQRHYVGDHGGDAIFIWHIMTHGSNWSICKAVCQLWQGSAWLTCAIPIPRIDVRDNLLRSCAGRIHSIQVSFRFPFVIHTHIRTHTGPTIGLDKSPKWTHCTYIRYEMHLA